MPVRLVISTVLFCVCLGGDVEVPWLCGGACGSNMVLQREPLQSRLWGVPGMLARGLVVTISLNGEEVANGQTAADGSWQLDLPAQPAGQGHRLDVTVGRLTAGLQNVAFGDVYICSGQSNMEYAIPGAFNVSEDIADSINYPGLRLFTLQYAKKRKLSACECDQQNQLHMGRVRSQHYSG